MENESLGMAMAKLAKLAKTLPPSATNGREKPVFSRFSQNSHSHREELNFPKGQTEPAFSQNSRFSHSHPGEINFSAEPRVTIEQLPERLVTAATRVCRELWNDTDEAVQEMLVDLTWHDPQDWEALISHFEQQLPPPPPKAIPALVTCSGCRHAEYRQHPAIAHCRMGVKSGVPAGGWFATDEHLCSKREEPNA